MLTSLNIQNVVLIDRLLLDCPAALTALTGETGAGKSILLDALGLALGGRAESGLVRKGSDQAIVTASFSMAPDHPVFAQLTAQGLENEDDEIILRRVVSANGKSRGFINDQPVSIGFLRQVGTVLVEIHGQFETHGLLDSGTHRGLLDGFLKNAAAQSRVADAWKTWRDVEVRRQAALADWEQAKKEEEYLRHVVAELEKLGPEAGEEDRLAKSRSIMMNSEKITSAVRAGHVDLTRDNGVETQLGKALGRLEKLAEAADGKLDAVISTLHRALLESEDAAGQLQNLAGDFQASEDSVNEIEERLFALRDCARKHSCAVDDLPDMFETLAARLALIDNSQELLERLTQEAAAAQSAYVTAAETLHAARIKSAAKLDKAVMAELAPLKLEKARFVTAVERQEAESKWGASGFSDVCFTVATNPGSHPGPLAKIASGGELARFMLALKLVLARGDAAPVLVFDEVDSGIGGAVAAAVGERLARLAADFQVLVVTHSPQVAARADHHWVVAKAETAGRVSTSVRPLARDERQEEIARMLSGEKITSEARAAAARLMDHDDQNQAA